MSVHMVMSVHVGEPVPVWHAGSGLKEPTLWRLLLPGHQSLLFISSVDLPYPPHSLIFPRLTQQLSFSLLFWSTVSACGPLRESSGVAQYSEVASFMCCVFRDPNMGEINLTTGND